VKVSHEEKLIKHHADCWASCGFRTASSISHHRRPTFAPSASILASAPLLEGAFENMERLLRVRYS